MAARLIENELTDLLGFLSLEAKADFKNVALQYLLGLTGSVEGMKLIENNEDLIEKAVELFADKCSGIGKAACVFVLNASASETVARKLQTLHTFDNILLYIVDKDCQFADNAAMLLSNLTRSEQGSELCLKSIERTPQYHLTTIFNVLLTEKYNKHVDLYHVAAILSNLSRLKDVRMVVFDKASGLMQRLLPYVSYQKSSICRKGIVGIIRNCCFEYGYHDWLLSDDVDILPILLLPLAGPEEFSESENDALPLDLQYLDDEKRRETDPEIRKMLVETLLMLCSTKSSRQYIKAKNAYVIIRELHKWEKDESVCQAIENLVQILIGDEPEEKMANLHEVKIPDDVQTQLEQHDKERKAKVSSNNKDLFC